MLRAQVFAAEIFERRAANGAGMAPQQHQHQQQRWGGGGGSGGRAKGPSHESKFTAMPKAVYVELAVAGAVQRTSATVDARRAEDRAGSQQLMPASRFSWELEHLELALPESI
eukprot:SAG11_NODE_11079_length_785_cov_1.045190_1_plen_112_part_10